MRKLVSLGTNSDIFAFKGYFDSNYRLRTVQDDLQDVFLYSFQNNTFLLKAVKNIFYSWFRSKIITLFRRCLLFWNYNQAEHFTQKIKWIKEALTPFWRQLNLSAEWVTSYFWPWEPAAQLLASPQIKLKFWLEFQVHCTQLPDFF